MSGCIKLDPNNLRDDYPLQSTPALAMAPLNRLLKLRSRCFSLDSDCRPSVL